MTPEEAQQAETAKAIKQQSSMADILSHQTYHVQLCALLEMVDSQAHRIEAMRKKLNDYSLVTEAAGSLMQKQYTADELHELMKVEHWEGRLGSKHKDWQDFNDVKYGAFWLAGFLGAIKEKEE